MVSKRIYFLVAFVFAVAIAFVPLVINAQNTEHVPPSVQERIKAKRQITHRHVVVGKITSISQEKIIIQTPNGQNLDIFLTAATEVDSKPNNNNLQQSVSLEDMVQVAFEANKLDTGYQLVALRIKKLQP